MIWCFYSLMRSGHHAIINWIIEGMSGKTLFVNDPPSYGFPEPHVINEYDHILYNLEDYKIEEGREWSSKKGILPDREIVILRDPFNLFASRFYRWKNPNHNISRLGWISKNALTTWKEHSNEDYISFNKWFLSGEYRETICKTLNIKNNENINQVPGYGDGSSFDLLNYKSNAKEMKVLDRYKLFSNKETLLFSSLSIGSFFFWNNCYWRKTNKDRVVLIDKRNLSCDSMVMNNEDFCYTDSMNREMLIFSDFYTQNDAYFFWKLFDNDIVRTSRKAFGNLGLEGVITL